MCALYARAGTNNSHTSDAISFSLIGFSAGLLTGCCAATWLSWKAWKLSNRYYYQRSSPRKDTRLNAGDAVPQGPVEPPPSQHSQAHNVTHGSTAIAHGPNAPPHTLLHSGVHGPTVDGQEVADVTVRDDVTARVTSSAHGSVEQLLQSQDDIVCEQLTRNLQMLGAAGQSHLSRSFVVVVGLGGVGSHAAAMLLRSGVGRMRLVDFDQVSLSSLNRHAVATRADVGTPKALCLQRHFLRIFPEVQVEALPLMFNVETCDRVLEGGPDYVLDCIDNIDTKVLLLSSCLLRQLPVLSSMGAGARLDPTRIRIADISDSSEDPLCRSVRQRLRRVMVKALSSASGSADAAAGIDGKRGSPLQSLHSLPSLRLQAVFSLEKPRAKLLDLYASTGQTFAPTAVAASAGAAVEAGSGADDADNSAAASGVAASTSAADGSANGSTAMNVSGTASVSAADFQVVPGFRVRVLPVLGTLPAIFGQFMATHVLTSLARLSPPPSLSYEPVLQLAREHYTRLHARLVDREEMRFGSDEDVEVDVDDIVFLVREVWRGKSARQHFKEWQEERAHRQASKHTRVGDGSSHVRSPVAGETASAGTGCLPAGKGVSEGQSSGDRSSGSVRRSDGDRGRAIWRSMQHLTFTRWNSSLPPTVDNLVLLTFEEAEHHEATSLDTLSLKEPDFVRMVADMLSRWT